MHFIDLTYINIKSGNGGNGCVSFRREKYVSKGGPDGGDGGKGGNIIAIADSKLSTLKDIQYKRNYFALNGGNGKGKKKHGANGKNTFLKLPLGTSIYNKETGDLLSDVTEINKEYLLLKGGIGGKGNVHFKSSVNQVPLKATDGKIGEKLGIKLELKLIADIGLVGFPNAGKSTLLKAISKADVKVAEYPFTTLTPNIGIYQEIDGFKITISDIPGIIEKAHLGKGLGLEFLRHISRTRILLFVLDSTSKNIYKDYHILLNELSKYDKNLIKKKRIIAVNKIDLIKKKINMDFDTIFVPISAFYKENIENLMKELKKICLEI